MWNITRRIQEHVDPHDTILDLMCGRCAPTRDIVARAKVGVDLHDEALREAALHCVALKMDAARVGEFFPPGSVDVVLWLDGVEHLERNTAVATLDAVERIARRKVVIHVPDIYFDNKDSCLYRDEGELQVHRCHFKLDFWTQRGYVLLVRYPSPDKHSSWLLLLDVGARRAREDAGCR